MNVSRYFKHKGKSELTAAGKRAVVAALVYEELGFNLYGRGVAVGNFICNMDRMLGRHRHDEERLAAQIRVLGKRADARNIRTK